MTRVSRAAAVPVALAMALALAGCGGQKRDNQAAGAAEKTAAGHPTHGGSGLAAPPPAPSPGSSGVKAKKRYVDGAGNRFTIWVAFGPPAGGGGCAISGPKGYLRTVLLMVRSEPKNKRSRGPRLGARNSAVAFPFGDMACSWDHTSSDKQVFKPGESKTFTGLVERVRNPGSAELILTVGPASGKKDLARIPYRSLLA